MPLGPGVRYRTRRIKGGHQRLAFKGNKVVEVKTMKNGKSKTRRKGRMKKKGK